MSKRILLLSIASFSLSNAVHMRVTTQNSYHSFFMALSNLEGIHVDLVGRLLTWMPLETVPDYNTMISRLEQVPTQMEQIIQLLSLGVEAGVTMHENSMVSIH